MSGVNNLKGFALMTLGFFSFALGDAMAKLLTSELSALQIVWLRTVGLFVGVCGLILVRGWAVLVSPCPGFQVLRGLAAVGSATCFIIAIRYVPLADAVAVTFVAPFIVTALGALLLKEPVGWRRWIAVAVGFVGMLVVIRPGQGVFHPAIFLIVVAASFFACRQLLSRRLSGVDSVKTTVAYTALISFSLTSLAMPFVWQSPDSGRVILLSVGLSVSAAVGEVLIIRALDMAQSVVLAPSHYTLIIWSSLYGYWLFGDIPDRWTLLGCSIIIASGTYTIYREYVVSRRGPV